MTIPPRLPEPVRLEGCAPSPLAHYLKALGVLRLVSEQIDAHARGWWSGEQFFLQSELDPEGLADFLLYRYEPTPLVAPWNGGSGFFPNDNKRAWSGLRNSPSSRFAAYQRAIATCLGILERFGLEEKPGDEVKPRVVQSLRNEAEDAVVEWIDAAAILTSGGTRYPPLLGTGGNDGRLEFTNNFMQQLNRLFDLETGHPTDSAPTWLAAALWKKPTAGLVEAAIGQFFPGAAGGPNASTGFEGHAVVNPWDFVLMMEGSLLFSAASHRRLVPGARESLAAPFTVQVVAAGNGALASREPEARAEVWMPLWDQPTRLNELQVIFREGRAQVGRRRARNGLDFARACAALGVDRGISAFQRYGFLKRAGRSYLATPLTRFPVRRRPESDLLNDIDAWLLQAQDVAARKTTPASLVRVVHHVEAAAFDLARIGGAATVQELLTALAAVEWTLSKSPGLRPNLPPIPRLSPTWAERSNDGSTAYRLALALASLYHPVAGRFRDHWSAARLGHYGLNQWLEEESPLRVWSDGPLTDNLIEVLTRRFLTAQQHNHPVKPTGGGVSSLLGDVATWIVAPRLDDRVASLAMGLALVSNVVASEPAPNDSPDLVVPPLPRAFAILALTLAPDELLREALHLPSETHVPVPDRLVGLLRAERINEASAVALRRLKASGIVQARIDHIPAWAVDPKRLAAALMFPLSRNGIRRLHRYVAGHRQIEAGAGP